MKYPVLGLLACGLATAAAASPERAEKFLRAGESAAALDELRLDLVAHPNNAVAQYNYAVGAYAAGIYPSAIETLTPLSTTTNPEIAARSQFQLGSANFRLAEQMRAANGVGAAVRFEEACKRFAYAAGQSGPMQADARKNLWLSHRAASAAYLQAARDQASAGDRAARVQPSDGFPAWEASLEFFAKALEHNPEDLAVTRENAVIRQRLADGYHASAERELRQAQLQIASSPERAIEQLRHALAAFAKSATFGHSDGAQGAARARRTLAQALLEFTDRRQRAAEQELERSAGAALENLNKATASWEESKKLTADATRLAQLHTALQATWYRAHVKRGDEQIEEAARASREGKANERLHALSGALDSYQQALGYQAEDENTKAKIVALHRKISAIYEQQGRQLLQLAQQKSAQNLEEAVASADKSVQSFRLSVEHVPQNLSARSGMEEAKQLLTDLQGRLKEEERKVAAKSQDGIKNPKDLKNLPKDLALKLLDYRNRQPAAKNPQLLTAPENKLLQDW